jgi:hypothetical protein
MKEKLKNAKIMLNEKGHAVDDFVENKADKHGFTKFQVWLGLLIAGIAAVAVVKWVL